MSDTPAAPRFINPAALFKAVPLQHPVEFGGTVHTHVHLRRMTAGEVAALIRTWQEARKADPDASVRFPIYADAGGAPLPQSFLDGLEADDFDAIDSEAVAFLPRRFRPAQEASPSASGPNGGGATEPTSAG